MGAPFNYTSTDRHAGHTPDINIASLIQHKWPFNILKGPWIFALNWLLVDLILSDLKENQLIYTLNCIYLEYE